jgi:hypothetical protein
VGDRHLQQDKGCGAILEQLVSGCEEFLIIQLVKGDGVLQRGCHGVIFSTFSTGLSVFEIALWLKYIPPHSSQCWSKSIGRAPRTGYGSRGFLAGGHDKVFASPRRKAKSRAGQSYDSLYQAGCKEGWYPQDIGWHTFRHSFGTLLKSQQRRSEDPFRSFYGTPTLRSRSTYTRAVKSQTDRKVVMIVPNVGAQ